MFTFNKLIVLSLVGISLVSCGQKKNESSKNTNKAKNTSLLAIWEREGTDKAVHHLQLKNSILNQPSEISYSLTENKRTLVCTGIVTLKGTESKGNIDKLELSVKSFHENKFDKTKAEEKCKEVESYYQSRTYTFKASLLTLCKLDETDCKEFY